MKIVLHLGHPAHFHMFKRVVKNLKANNHQVYILIKSKDVLEDLLIESGLEYINMWEKGRTENKFSNYLGLISQDFRIFKYCLKIKPDLLIGSSIAITHVGKVLSIPSFYFGEDDADVVPKASRLSLPYATEIISPDICNKGKWDYKKTGYAGYQKLAYLHPKQFTPDKQIAEKYVDLNKPYFIIRFANLIAHHDDNIKGIGDELIENMINILEERGNIYITSERDLPDKFEKYRLSINPLVMHHIMAFADIFIGDSQSMCAESGLLGVPFIRFNDFVGKISYLNEIENKYKLGYGISSSNKKEFFIRLKKILNENNRKIIYKQRLEQLLADKIDVTAFYTWFIENYPESSKIMKENPEYQYNFK